MPPIIYSLLAIVLFIVGFFLGKRVRPNAAASEEAAAQRQRADELAKGKAALEAERNAERDAHDRLVGELKRQHDRQIETLRETQAQQLLQVQETAKSQLETLQKMNREQMEHQTRAIKEQMQVTSEEVLKRRQDELGERNREEVSKIIDPLQKSLSDMRQALDKSKEQQSQALADLNATIKVNMEKSAELGQTADRLANALTGEVKVQGNFGELKLRQLLEDLGLQEGEQFFSQETLRDKYGRAKRSDDGHSLIPDFVLRFPNERYVVVDSKMSLTDYERYMNTPDGDPEKSYFLQQHIKSVRNQVDLLAKKDYTRYLPEGCNRLDFAMMYVPIEGALNLAILNDAALWHEAYERGVMIVGPQTMFMNLRILEMMWTQVRQLHNQQAVMDAASSIVERVQEFGARFAAVEKCMNDTIQKMNSLKIITADHGPSIITSARQLLAAGAKENKKKPSLAHIGENIFIEDEAPAMLTSDASAIETPELSEATETPAASESAETADTPKEAGVKAKKTKKAKAGKGSTEM